MPTTSRGYRYPAGSDAPNGPQGISNLAADVNTDVGTIAGKLDSWIYNLFARKTTNESVSSATTGTTLQNDDDLFLTVVANAVYRIEGVLKMASPSAADLKLAFTVPAGATFDWSLHGIIAAASATTDDFLAGLTAASTQSVGGFGAGTVIGKVDGLLVVGGTAGTIRLQWAQDTANAGGTSMLAGSFLEGRRKA